MKYDNLKINFEENKKGLIEAFVIVLGEEFRELITNNINNLILIDFITMQQYQFYLEKNNIDPNTNDDFINDDTKEKSIKNSYNKKFIEKLAEIIPDNGLIQSELQKSRGDSNYETPLFNGILGIKNYDTTFAKFMILEELGYNLDIKKPYIIYKEKNNAIIEEHWNGLFSEEETEIIGKLAKQMSYELDCEIILNTGTIKKNQDFYDSHNLLIDKSFSYKNIAENSKSRYVAPNVSLDNNEVTPILVFCPLVCIDEDLLLSFIHELTHAISMNLLNNTDRINIKAGIMELDFAREVNIYNDEELLKDNPNFLEQYEKRNYLNEAITQYIATLVTQVIIDYKLCNTLFSFNIPNQKAKFESSYINLITCFKDFFENNFDDVKQCYLGKTITSTIGNISFQNLVELANKVHKDSDIIEQTRLELSNSIKHT